MVASKTISASAGQFGLPQGADVDTFGVMEVQNNSGGNRFPGDVVVIDVTGVLATTTTTVNDKTVLGVVASKNALSSLATYNSATDAYAAGAAMPVIIYGPARINIAANVVAAGDVLTTSAAAGVAAVNAGAPAANAVVKSLIAVALEASAAKDANNTIRAFVNKS